MALTLILIAFISSFFAIVLLRPFSIKIGLVDTPCERKTHNGSIPLVGGGAVYIGVLITSLFIFFIFPEHIEHLLIYLFASLLMVITGALDDCYDLSVRIRLVVQVLIACIMMFVANNVIFELGDLLSIGDISLWHFAYPFTVLSVICAINAFNMVDGIDGLIGGISVATFITLAILFALSEDYALSLFSLIFVAALIPYLMSNLQYFPFKNKKIFMGDAGSMFIGFTIAWLLAIGTQGHLVEVNVDGSAFSPVVALWVIALPVMDMVAILMRRVKKGQSPFKPDRGHLHHIFMRAGFSAREVLVIITIIALSLNSIGVLASLYAVPDWIQLVTFIFIFIVYKQSLAHAWVLVSIYRRVKSLKTDEQ